MKSVKLIGLGSMGCISLEEISKGQTAPTLTLDTDISMIKYYNPNADKKILCGKELCRGLGCGGYVEKGYDSAKETLTNKMHLFYEKEINIFVLGLGGGAGSGMIEFILENMSKSNNKIKNKINVVIATYPLSIEKNLNLKARIVLDKIKTKCDLIVLVRLNELNISMKPNGKELIHPDFFQNVREKFSTLLKNILKLNQDEFMEYVKLYSQNKKVLVVDTFDDLTNSFVNK